MLVVERRGARVWLGREAVGDVSGSLFGMWIREGGLSGLSF